MLVRDEGRQDGEHEPLAVARDTGVGAQVEIGVPVERQAFGPVDEARDVFGPLAAVAQQRDQQGSPKAPLITRSPDRTNWPELRRSYCDIGSWASTPHSNDFK